MYFVSRLVVRLFTLAVFVFSAASIAVENSQLSPYAVLETVGNQLFARISANQQEIQKFPKLMNNIVEEELMPAIDYQYAAYRILGKHLKNTTKEQRALFVDAMRSYLVRTYAAALKQYKNQQVVFEPEKPVKDKKMVDIKTQIIEMNKPTIDVVFKMRQNKQTGQWKVFDLVVEGISLLSSKQAELSGKISKQGVEQVSLELAALAQ